MKITILDVESQDEEEIIIKCHEMNDDIKNLISTIKNGNQKITGYADDGIHLLEPSDIYYFEALEQKVFAYCKSEIYEVRQRLYELESGLMVHSFIRTSKSIILNLDKIKSLSPAFGGRFEATLDNKEKVIISRQYVSVLKERLGV